MSTQLGQRTMELFTQLISQTKNIIDQLKAEKRELIQDGMEEGYQMDNIECKLAYYHDELRGMEKAHRQAEYLFDDVERLIDYVDDIILDKAASRMALVKIKEALNNISQKIEKSQVQETE